MPRPAGCCARPSTGSKVRARSASSTTIWTAQWPADFVDFVKREKLFATFLTPSEFAAGNPDKRWDAARNAALSEILGFYGLTYWYTEQVTILGLGPIWQSENKDAKLRAADDLDAGEVMAFGLSER